MNKSILSLLAAGAAVLLAAGCAHTTEKVQYVPVPAYDGGDSVLMLGEGVQQSISCTGIQEQLLPDGRLEIVARLHNRENRRLEVQAKCVFKDQNGFSTGDETPFVMVILTETGTEDVRFVSMNNLAKKCTISVRQAH
jgi:hypothetical protein